MLSEPPTLLMGKNYNHQYKVQLEVILIEKTAKLDKCEERKERRKKVIELRKTRQTKNPKNTPKKSVFNR